jgi:hypothetical protein
MTQTTTARTDCFGFQNGIFLKWTFDDAKKYGAKINCALPRQKGLQPLAIHRDITATLGAEAVGYSSMTRYLRDPVLFSSNPVPALPEQECQPDDCGQAILRALAEQPFPLIRELSRLTQLPRTTVHTRLTQSLGFRVRHLGWVPHRLSHSRKLNGVTLSQELLSVLERQKS